MPITRQSNINMSFSRAPILRFNDSKPNGNIVSSMKAQHLPRNEKRSSSTQRSPSVARSKKNAGDSEGKPPTSARSPWRTSALLRAAAPTSFSLPTTPVSCTATSSTAATPSPSAPVHFSSTPLPPPPSDSPAQTAPHPRAATPRRGASPARGLLVRGVAARPVTSPDTFGTVGAPPTPSLLGCVDPAVAACGSTAPAESGDGVQNGVKGVVARTAAIKEAAGSSSDRRSVQSNASSDSPKEGAHGFYSFERPTSHCAVSREKRMIDKRKNVLEQQYQEKRRRFLSAKRELRDKKKSAAEIFYGLQEIKQRYKEATGRELSSEEDGQRSDKDRFFTPDASHSEKEKSDAELCNKKGDEQDVGRDVGQKSDGVVKVEVPRESLGSWLKKMVQGTSEAYIGLCKEVIKKRNHVLSLVGELLEMRKPVVSSELKKQLRECQTEADQFDRYVESVRKKQMKSVASLGDALSDLVNEHEKVKKQLANALKAKNELQTKRGEGSFSPARMAARAVAEEKRLRGQVEKISAQLKELTGELERERQSKERLDEKTSALGQQLKEANGQVQDLKTKLTKQTDISQQMKEAVRTNQVQIHNMIIERCSMLREYTEIKNKADTEVDMIVREMETRLDLVNRRLQEEIEMSERLRDQNWKFRNRLEEVEARKRAVELFDRAVQADGPLRAADVSTTPVPASASTSVPVSIPVSVTESVVSGDYDTTAGRTSPVSPSDNDVIAEYREDIPDDEDDEPNDDDDDEPNEEEQNEEENDDEIDEDDDTEGRHRGAGDRGTDHTSRSDLERDRPEDEAEDDEDRESPYDTPPNGYCDSVGTEALGDAAARRPRGFSLSESAMNGRDTPTPPEPDSELCTSELDTETDGEAKVERDAEEEEEEEEEETEVKDSAKEAVTVWERHPRPIASPDTDASCIADMDDEEDNTSQSRSRSRVRSDVSSHCEHKRREQELLSEMETANRALKKEKEFAKALEEEMIKIQVQKANLEVESIKIADEKATLKQSIQKAAIREKELREHFEKEFVKKLLNELIPKEQEIERLQHQVKELTTLSDVNKQQFVEYERRMKELAFSFEAPNAQGGVVTLREIVSDLHKHVDTMRQSLQEMRGRNEELERALALKGAEAEAQAELARKRSQALQARDAQLQSLSAAMRVRDRHSIKIEKEVRRQTEQMVELQGLLQMRDAQLSRLAEMVEELNNARFQNSGADFFVPPAPTFGDGSTPPPQSQLQSPQTSQMQLQQLSRPPSQMQVQQVLRPPSQIQVQQVPRPPSQTHIVRPSPVSQMHIVPSSPTSQMHLQAQAPPQLQMQLQTKSPPPLQMQVQPAMQPHSLQQSQEQMHIQMQQQMQRQMHTHLQSQLQQPVQPHMQPKMQPIVPPQQPPLPHLQQLVQPHIQSQQQLQQHLHTQHQPQQQFQPQQQPHSQHQLLLQQKLQTVQQQHVHPRQQLPLLPRMPQQQHQPTQQKLQPQQHPHLHQQLQQKMQSQFTSQQHLQHSAHTQNTQTPQNFDLSGSSDDDFITQRTSSLKLGGAVNEKHGSGDSGSGARGGEGAGDAGAAAGGAPVSRCSSDGTVTCSAAKDAARELEQVMQWSPEIVRVISEAAALAGVDKMFSPTASRSPSFHVGPNCWPCEPRPDSPAAAGTGPVPGPGDAPQHNASRMSLPATGPAPQQPHNARGRHVRAASVAAWPPRPPPPSSHAWTSAPSTPTVTSRGASAALAALRASLAATPASPAPPPPSPQPPRPQTPPQQVLPPKPRPPARALPSSEPSTPSTSPPPSCPSSPTPPGSLDAAKTWRTAQPQDLKSKLHREHSAPSALHGRRDPRVTRADAVRDAAVEAAGRLRAFLNKVQSADEPTEDFSRRASKPCLRELEAFDFAVPKTRIFDKGLETSDSDRPESDRCMEPFGTFLENSKSSKNSPTSIAAVVSSFTSAVGGFFAEAASGKVVQRESHTTDSSPSAPKTPSKKPTTPSGAVQGGFPRRPRTPTQRPASSLSALRRREDFADRGLSQEHLSGSRAASVPDSPLAAAGGGATTFVAPPRSARRPRSTRWLRSQEAARRQTPTSQQRAMEARPRLDRSPTTGTTQGPAGTAAFGDAASVEEDMARRVLGVRRRSPTSRSRPPGSLAWRTPFIQPPEEAQPATLLESRRSRSLDRGRLQEFEWPAAGEPGRSKEKSVTASRVTEISRPCTAPSPARQKLSWCIVPRRDEPEPPNALQNPGSITGNGQQLRSDSPGYSSYNTILQEHFVDSEDQPSFSKNAEKNFDCANRCVWVCRATSPHVDERPHSSFTPRSSRWKDGNDANASTYGCREPSRDAEDDPQDEESSSLAAPSRDPGLQVPTHDSFLDSPPTQHFPPGGAAGDGTGGSDQIITARSRSLSPDFGERRSQRHRLSPFRHITELPKIVEFTEESSMDSTSNDSTTAIKGSSNSKVCPEEGKNIIIRYKKLDPNTRNVRFGVFSACNLNPTSKVCKEIESSETLSPVSSESTIMESKISNDDGKLIQPPKQVVPYIQEVKRIMDNLESMLETHMSNDQSSVASKSISSQTVPEFLAEVGSFTDESINQGRERRSSKSQQWETEDARIALNRSDASVDSREIISEKSSVLSVSKQRVSNKNSSCSLSSKRRSGLRHPSSRCPMEENVIIPCVTHNCIKRRTRSGSNIHDDQCTCEYKMLIPEFHIVHANCICQLNRGKFQP